MFLIKFLLVHLSRRLTGELIAYIRRHPASTRRPSVCQYYQMKPFGRFSHTTGLQGGGGRSYMQCVLFQAEKNLDTCKSGKKQVLQCQWGFLRNTIDVSLAPYNYHGILRYLRIQSLDLADIRSHPIHCIVSMSTLPASSKNYREKVETPL